MAGTAAGALNRAGKSTRDHKRKGGISPMPPFLFLWSNRERESLQLLPPPLPQVRPQAFEAIHLTFLLPPSSCLLPAVVFLLSRHAPAARTSEVHSGQRTALIGIADAQNGHSRVMAATGFLNRLTCFTSRNTANATIANSITVFRNRP